MTDLENSLQEKPTAELQHSLKFNRLTEEAAVVARAILERRGASIPEAVPEEVMEESFRKARSNSNRSLLITLVLLMFWAVYGYVTGQFEPGQQERLNQSMKITGLLIASVWGWGAFGKKNR